MGHSIIAEVLAAITFGLLATFPGWHQEVNEETGSDVDVKPFPTKLGTHAALACASFGAVAAFLAALWQHTGAVVALSIIEQLTYGMVNTKVGVVSAALAWTSIIPLIVCAIGVYVLITSIKLLDRLTNDDD